MFRIEDVREIDGQKNAVMDIQVSTASDLPSLGDLVSGAGYVNIKVASGSFAHVIQAGAWYTLDDNGTWYDASGTPASSASNNSLNASLLSAPKNLGGERDEVTDEPDVTDKIEKSILYPDEPELTEPELTEKEQPEMKKSEPTESEVTEDER